MLSRLVVVALLLLVAALYMTAYADIRINIVVYHPETGKPAADTKITVYTSINGKTKVIAKTTTDGAGRCTVEVPESLQNVIVLATFRSNLHCMQIIDLTAVKTRELNVTMRCDKYHFLHVRTYLSTPGKQDREPINIKFGLVYAGIYWIPFTSPVKIYTSIPVGMGIYLDFPERAQLSPLEAADFVRAEVNGTPAEVRPLNISSYVELKYYRVVVPYRIGGEFVYSAVVDVLYRREVLPSPTFLGALVIAVSLLACGGLIYATIRLRRSEAVQAEFT